MSTLAPAREEAAPGGRSAPPVERPRPPVGPPLGPGSIRLGFLAAIVVGVAGFTAYSLNQSGFVWDDFVNARVAQQEGLTFGYLRRPIFEHIIPGYKLVNWIFQEIAPLDFRLPAAFSVLCMALIVVLMHRLLAELFRPGATCLVLSLCFGTSLVLAGTAIWWGATLVRLPALVLGLTAVLSYVRYQRTREKRLLVLSVAFATLGLAFGEEAIYFVGLMGLLRLLVLYPRETLGQSIVGTAREWRTWLPFLIPLALVVIATVNQTTENEQLASAGAVARFVKTAWVEVFPPALLGFFVNTGPLSSTEALLIALAQVVVLGTVIATIVRRPAAWRPWLLFAIVFLVTEIPAPLRRQESVPEELAHGYRFHVMALVAFTIALAAALSPARNGARARPQPRPPVPTWRRALVGVTVTAYLVSSLIGVSRFLEGWYGRYTKVYVSAMKDSLDTVERSDGRMTLVDADAPDYVVHPNFGPYDRLSELAALVHSRAVFSTTGAELFQLSDLGRLQPVRFSPVHTVRPRPQVAAGKMFVSEEKAHEFDGDSVCTTSASNTAYVAWILPETLPTANWYLRLQYRGGSSGQIAVLVDVGKGFAAGPEWVIPVKRTGGEGLARLPAAGLSRILLAMPADARLCLDELTVARVEPR